LSIYSQILSQYWGYSEFRPLQQEIIESVGRGEDTLALMPTGGGKSVTFQVPALAAEGICIVITPLIALMKDQVDQLKKRKIRAMAIHSGMTGEEIGVALDNCIYGDYKFLYVSPERLGTELFRTRVREMQVNLIAVDEAHCISQWGYDFRPSYLQISSLREILKGVPVLALTATATPEVCNDIQVRLLFRKKNLLQSSFERKNLAYVVRKTEDKPGELTGIVQKLGGSGIVYVRNRKKSRDLAGMLSGKGIPAEYYHAGLKHAERDERQRGWSGDSFRVMVATNAFGMGIDKPDVRFVIHVDLPDNPEAYFQEAGRAGRDGKKAYAILLYSPADKKLAEKRVAVNFPDIPRIRQIYAALSNFLQVPVGSGKGQQYDFEMGEFLTRYRLNALVVHSALSILTREGYIEVTEAIHNPSRIMFRTGRDELYSFQVKHAELDGFIKLLLRSYSGLFSQYAVIDESFLAKQTGLSTGQVKRFLQDLSGRQIIHYIPRKNVPVVTFLEERLDEKNLLISPEMYRFRKERYIKRVREMLRYTGSETICRSQFLLSYFGQRDAPRCGICDVCLKGKAEGPDSPGFLEVAGMIRKTLAAGACTLEELIAAAGREADLVIRVTEWLVDRGEISRNSELRFVLADRSP